MAKLLYGLLAAGCIGLLVNVGLASVPPILEAQDRANCRLQQTLPSISAERQAHCARR